MQYVTLWRQYSLFISLKGDFLGRMTPQRHLFQFYFRLTLGHCLDTNVFKRNYQQQNLYSFTV